ncbi:MAG: MaoC family dehydratase N-terminal domain-containing protein [Chloroflexi bacterium]|nr:MaoC family dehydratase N-terminal domain-containing protein [Chloroflexota bacterium]
MYFEEFTVGLEVITQGRTITETDIVNFAGISGDYNAIHTDAEFSKNTPFGERISHGLLGLSVATGLGMQLGFLDGTVIAFIGLEWKFKNPIKIGDTIHMTAKVKQTKAMKAMGGGFVIFDARVLNQRNEVAQQGEWTLLMKSKIQGGAVLEMGD